MKKILITGGSGYLGRSLAEYLGQWPEEYAVECISVRGEDWKERSFGGFDAVYHTAAIVHQPQSKNDPAQAEAYDRVNARLPVEIAAKAKAEGVGQFVFLSTMAVYGLDAPVGKTVVIGADTPLEPRDLYGQSKAKAEEGLKALADDHFRVAVLRPPMIYGKGCKGNYGTLVKFATKLPAFPLISNQRSMLYVENLCQLVKILIDRGEGGVFCPQNREYVNTCRMMEQIALAHGKKWMLVPGLGWSMQILRHLTGKVDKAFGSLCYDPAVSGFELGYAVVDFEESVKRTEA